MLEITDTRGMVGSATTTINSSKSESPSDSEFPNVASLIACLEHTLFDDVNHGSESPKLAVHLPEASEMAKTWKPGKTTDVLQRFRNGDLASLYSQSRIRVENGHEFKLQTGVSNLSKKSIYGPKTGIVTEADTFEKPVSSIRRQFRPPSRKPASEIGKDDGGSNLSSITAVETLLPSSNQTLFTTHSQFSSSLTSSSNSNPQSSTSFNFLGHKRFHSNARAAYEKRSFNSRKPKRYSPEREEETATASQVPLKSTLESQPPANPPFRSAYEVMVIEDKARGIKRALPPPSSSTNLNAPIQKIAKMEAAKNGGEGSESDNPEVNLLMLDERLKNVEPKMVEAILNEVVELGASTDWNDIAGLEGVKAIIREIIIWPMQRPDLFTGLRGPPKGILLFGPPGTGKTMFGRLIATKSSSTFFNISASSLMSKWCGDGEKMVRALFQVARVKQPSVVFIDEIDSILTQRSDSEHETSRRLKTEFLIQFDGCATKSDDKLLVIGVTNRPQELDEAARRRLVKRIYIPLPESNGRQQLIRNLLADQNKSFSDDEYEEVAKLTDGYSGADMASLCKEAAYGPIRDIGHDIQTIELDKVRPIEFQDFKHALKHVKASVAPSDLKQYETWDKQFGCHV